MRVGQHPRVATSDPLGIGVDRQAGDVNCIVHQQLSGLSRTRACLLIDSEVDHGVGQGDATEEGQGVFVVPCGDAAPLLEA